LGDPRSNVSLVEREGDCRQSPAPGLFVVAVIAVILGSTGITRGVAHFIKTAFCISVAIATFLFRSRS
jgi:uncharacterized membrane protein YtjA (UPF0391 family)